MPNNEMAVIILEGILENILYKTLYDKDNPGAPDCYAFGRDQATIAPHEDVENPESDTCALCPQNKWKSNPNGRGGKWCGNRRRLAIISAGSFIGGQFQATTDPQHFSEADIAYLKLPVMSVANYQGYVKQVGNALHRPPYAVFTKIKVVPDGDSQFRVTFDVLGKVPDELRSVIEARHTQAVEEIEFPYAPMAEQPEPLPAQAVRAAGAKAAPVRKSKF